MRAIDLLRSYDEPNMTAIADLLDAIDALHQPLTVSALDYDCYHENCEHDECSNVAIVVCASCYEIANAIDDEWVPDEVVWPCPTARVLRPEDGGQ